MKNSYIISVLSYTSEVDYILFYRLEEGEEVPINPSDDEVEEVKWVSMDELKEMMADPELLWSPWFVGIMEQEGFDYWKDIEGSLTGKNTDKKVRFFNPPSEHVGVHNKPFHTRQTGIWTYLYLLLQD